MMDRASGERRVATHRRGVVNEWRWRRGAARRSDIYIYIWAKGKLAAVVSNNISNGWVEWAVAFVVFMEENV